MVRPLDTVFAVIRSADGGVLGARLRDEGESAAWSLPAGPVESAGVRASAAHWCQSLTGQDAEIGNLVSIRFGGPAPTRALRARPAGTVFGFEAWVPGLAPGSFEAHEGAVICRFFEPTSLLERLPPFERGVLAASLKGIESSTVVEWTAEGEFTASRALQWSRMMPSLPHPYGPVTVDDASRGIRTRSTKKR